MANGKRKFFIVDPELRAFRGHYYNYIQSVAAEAIRRGLQPVILGSRKLDARIESTLRADRVFSRSVWVMNPHPMPGNALLHFYSMAVFFLELRSALRRHEMDDTSILLFPTLLGFHLLPIALLLLRAKSRAVLLFRYQTDFYRSSSWAALGFRLLQRQAGRISLVSDSHRLAAELRSLTSLPVHVVPIPHIPEHALRAGASKPVKFYFLGDAREEKGIVELCAAIEQLEVSRDREFFLQINDPDTRAARQAIARLRQKNRTDVHFIETPLSGQQYQEALAKADVILLPYRSENYKSRTSGLFAEALAAGKPVIVLKGTWLSELARALDTGLICADSSPAAITKAIEDARREMEVLRARADKAREPWMQYNNPRRLLDAVVDLDFSLPDYLKSIEPRPAGQPSEGAE